MSYKCVPVTYSACILCMTIINQHLTHSLSILHYNTKCHMFQGTCIIKVTKVGYTIMKYSVVGRYSWNRLHDIQDTFCINEKQRQQK